MTRLLRGVVHGKVIEVTEDLGMSDGQVVDLIITPSAAVEPPPSVDQALRLPKTLPGPPPGWRAGVPSASAGSLADEWSEQDDKILELIHTERKAATWRELPE
jgi:hypothetical protein